MKNKMFLTKYEALAYSVLRIVLGFLFLWHGSQKLFGFPPPGYAIPMYQLIIAGPIEFFGGLFTLAGFLTRWTTFICSGEMAFAYWYAHSLHGVLPLVNHGELAVIYCFLFLYVASRGPGNFSIDYLISRREP
jgi:putative oxidoreductase